MPQARARDGEARAEIPRRPRRHRLRAERDALPGRVQDEGHVAVLLGEVAHQRAHLHASRPAQPAQPGQHLHVLDVDRVDRAHVHLAEQPAVIPPAPGAEAVHRRRAPVGQVGAAAQRRHLDHQRVAPSLQPVEVDLVGKQAGEAADGAAVEPDLGAVVGALEAHLPEAASLARGPGEGELPPVPADRGPVQGGVGGVPAVRHRDGRPALEVLLVVPALGVAGDERVVLSEVPLAAQQLSPGLPLADQRLAAGRLDPELRRRRLRRHRRRLRSALRVAGRRGGGEQGQADEADGRKAHERTERRA